ncbi:hydrolase [Aureliella helgolandensis]|uniref:Carboxypeptidase G2 n=1 Tax=Aureliella helgolandensis TaxID=2527968 RepID=A0A518GHP9_9BACT|nr:hydrolase [Aureliella helgolandensis]QDV28098.1 Carboxypeptidase G2 precursor [Aureliella helgolandensis]
MNAAHHWLDAQQEAMRSDLVELANQNSGSNNLAGLEQVAQWLEAWMDFPDATARRIALPPRCEIDDLGQEIELQTGPALRWDCRPQAARRLLLAIHYDTVFPAGHPFQRCRILDSDRLQGPGVADAKGGIVVIRNALRAVEQFGLAPDCGWTVLLNPDEELGSPHSSSLLARLASEFDVGFLFEPALPTGEMVAQRKGSGNFTVVIGGRSAHAGRSFEEGRSAVAKLCEFLYGLHGLNGQRPGLTLNVAWIGGGGPLNVVPDRAVGRWNVRLSDQESIAWFESELQNRVAAVEQTEGFTCHVSGNITSPPKLRTPAIEALMEAIGQESLQLGLEEVQWVSTGGVCDGNKLAAAGLPNVDTLGPIGGGLHSKEEWVETSSLVDKSKLLVNLLQRFSAGQLL